MNWIELNGLLQVDSIREKSGEKPLDIFKHSSRCAVSSLVLNKLEKSACSPAADFYFLYLIKHRDVSDKIAEEFSVYHESPQILVIRNGECIYDESHFAINMDDIAEQAASVLIPPLFAYFCFKASPQLYVLYF